MEAAENLEVKRPLHFIVGGGNLGMDLYGAIRRQSSQNSVRLLTKRLGFSYPQTSYGLDEISTTAPDVIWLPIGAGSVGGDFLQQLDIHVRLVVEVMKEAAPGCRVIAFSTDYVASTTSPYDPQEDITENDEPPSDYARSKLWMEHYIRAARDPRVRVIRVGSLYGEWKPQGCFPMTLSVHSYGKSDPVTLPINEVTPTPTKWLAETLVQNLDRIFEGQEPVHHCAPSGSVSTADWGKLILGDDRVAYGTEDWKRPVRSNLGCSFLEQTPSWRDLWDVYGTEIVLGRSTAKL